MKNLRQKKMLSRKLEAALRPHPVRFAYLYGSIARGDALHSESDIDVAIDPRPTLRPSQQDRLQLALMEGIARALDVPLERVDVKLLPRLPLPLAFRIHSEGVPLAIRDRAAYTREFLRVTARYHDEEPILRAEQKRYFARLRTI